MVTWMGSVFQRGSYINKKLPGDFSTEAYSLIAYVSFLAEKRRSAKTADKFIDHEIT
jgi:hypothetical protein